MKPVITCPRCQQEKPVYRFNRCVKGTYGVQGYCRPCNADYHKRWRGKQLRSCGYCMEIKLQEEFRERMCSSCFEAKAHWGAKRQCAVAECGRAVDTRRVDGLCPPHRRRATRYGDPCAGPPLRAVPNPAGYKDRQGYIRIRHKGRGRFQHQVVMERKLGRALWPWENVHHRNGIRHDNRPENLELWVRSQPSGQRVSDQVSHAIKILSAYAPHLLVFVPDEETA